MTRGYELHGLRLATGIPLAEPVTELEGPADLEIHASAPGAIDRLTTEPVAIRHLVETGTVHYEGYRDPAGAWTIRVPGLVGVTVRDAAAAIQLDPTTDPGTLPIFAGGLCLGLFLAVTGRLCLHASAVEADGRAVALSAPSGCGKSTLVALAAAAGYPLVADDLLRVGFDGTRPDVYRGAGEIRLRAGAAKLERHWPHHSRITADGRTAVAPPRTGRSVLPLAALVFPVLDRDRSDIAIERLPPARAFAPLLTAPRLLGWRDPSVVTSEFEQLAALAADVPVLVARVPWCTPATPQIGARLVECVLDAC